VASSLAALTSFTAQQWSACRVLRLSGLDLSGQWPACLTPAILSQLYQLELSGCNLSVLPPSLQHATSLRVLDLRGNKLERLPEWFQILSFPELTYFNVADNKLLDLPLALGYFPQLCYLNAQFNPKLPAHLTAQIESEPRAPGALLRYLKDCAAGETQSQRRFRLMLLGEPNVGKSALVECLKTAPGWFTNHLNHNRARTQYPVMFTFEYTADRPAAAAWHVLITDPPGTVIADGFITFLDVN